MRQDEPTRGFVVLPYLIALAVLGLGAVLLKPKFLDGESKRAAASVEATSALLAAETARGASVASSLTAIGHANTLAPASPARDFIGREIPAALAKSPAPDPVELLAAEKRRSAVMEGRAEEAERLYGIEAQNSTKLKADLDKALEARRKADSDLSEAAAAHLALERQRNIQIAVIVVLVLLWGYAKLYSISPSTLGRMAADIRSGTPAIQAFDVNLAPWLHSSVRKASQLATHPKE